MCVRGEVFVCLDLGARKGQGANDDAKVLARLLQGVGFQEIHHLAYVCVRACVYVCVCACVVPQHSVKSEEDMAEPKATTT